MVKHIAVNGRSFAVLNTMSCGPGCAPSTYELTGGAYVYAVGSSWWMQERGRDKRAVFVAAAE